MAIKDPNKVAAQALATLRADRDNRLLRIDAYERGEQDNPYMPDSADAEYKLLAARAVTNVMPFLISTPAEMVYVDSFRRGNSSRQDTGVKDDAQTRTVQPEWDHWQRSRLDGRQGPIYRGALKFGHSFVSTLKDDDGNVISKGLSALKTVALYEDAASDEDPYATLTITRWPSGTGDEAKPGLATMWDDTYEYPVTFKAMDDAKSVRVSAGKKHGASINPVTRFTAAVDLEGRTMGIVEPMMVLQDRINQTVFDLLVVQSYASFTVRTISGMAPPVKLQALDADGNKVENPELDPDLVADWVPAMDPRTGRPIPEAIQLSAKRLLIAEDPDTKFNNLEGTPLEGFIKSIELAFRHMAVLSQTPPHNILGEIANLSAEAMDAAERALQRKVEEFKASFGESWERVFRVAAEIGDFPGEDDYHSEVLWRDDRMAGSMSQVADALGKMAEQLGIPPRALWEMVPGVTANQLAHWERLYNEDNPDVAQAQATSRASTRPTFRRDTTTDTGGTEQQ